MEGGEREWAGERVLTFVFVMVKIANVLIFHQH